MSHRVGSVYKKPAEKQKIDLAEIIGAPLVLGGVVYMLYLLLLIGGVQ